MFSVFSPALVLPFYSIKYLRISRPLPTRTRHSHVIISNNGNRHSFNIQHSSFTR